MTPDHIVVTSIEQLDIIQRHQSGSCTPTHRCVKCGSLWMQALSGHMLIGTVHIGCGCELEPIPRAKH